MLDITSLRRPNNLSTIIILLSFIGGTLYGYNQQSAKIPQTITHHATKAFKGERATDDRADSNDARATAIKSYLEAYGSSHSQVSKAIVTAGDTYGVDPFMLTAIFVVESSAGRNCYQNNCMGWGIYGNNRYNFDSVVAGFDVVARNLSEHPYYAGRTNKEKLLIYNPNPAYSVKVLSLAKEIKEEDGEP